MCVGIPMQVVEVGEFEAVCEADGTCRAVSAMLLDRPPSPGDWVMVHMNAAVRTMTAEEAELVRDALSAVLMAAQGQSFEHLLGDLIDREPQLPEHLRPRQHEEEQPCQPAPSTV